MRRRQICKYRQHMADERADSDKISPCWHVQNLICVFQLIANVTRVADSVNVFSSYFNVEHIRLAFNEPYGAVRVTPVRWGYRLRWEATGGGDWTGVSVDVSYVDHICGPRIHQMCGLGLIGQFVSFFLFLQVKVGGRRIMRAGNDGEKKIGVLIMTRWEDHDEYFGTRGLVVDSGHSGAKTRYRRLQSIPVGLSLIRIDPGSL